MTSVRPLNRRLSTHTAWHLPARCTLWACHKPGPSVASHLLLVQARGDAQIRCQRGASVAQQQREVEGCDCVALERGGILRQAKAVLHPVHNPMILQSGRGTSVAAVMRTEGAWY